MRTQINGKGSRWHHFEVRPKSRKTLNDLDPIVQEVNDLDERKRLLICLGVVMSELNAGIVIPIIKQYPEPEMDPDAPESAHDGSR